MITSQHHPGGKVIILNYFFQVQIADKHLCVMIILTLFIAGRAVARILKWGGQLASEASKLRNSARSAEPARGFGGAAPNGVQGQSPLPGARGAEPPGKF